MTAVPLILGQRETLDSEPDADMIWSLLLSFANVRERGRKLFTGSLAWRNRLLDEFSNYIRQAHAYFAAAVPVQDSSAALLYYYASLNLGKAELLTTNPHAIYQCTVHHGLSYSPGSSALPMTARLKVKPGVFRLLLDKRVGTQTPANQSLAVGRLMPRATENYTRLEDESWSESRLARVHHSVGWDATHIWSSVATPSAEVFLDHPRTAQRWNAALTETFSPDLGDLVFQIKHPYLRWRFFQSREPSPLQTPGHVSATDVTTLITRTASDLLGVVEAPYDLGAEGTAYASLLKTRQLAIPPSLCNYALMFYCSSLARYEPSKLDQRIYGLQAWGLHYFVQNTAIRLLSDAYYGITGTRLLFTGYRGRRV